MPAIGATNTPALSDSDSTYAPIFIPGKSAKRERILSANLFSGNSAHAEDHAAREESARGGKDIERGERRAARRAQKRICADEAGGEKVGDADRCRRVQAPLRGEARKRSCGGFFPAQGGCELPCVA